MNHILVAPEKCWAYKEHSIVVTGFEPNDLKDPSECTSGPPSVFPNQSNLFEKIDFVFFNVQWVFFTYMLFFEQENFAFRSWC